ncbi:tripartite tricarboxylate transporter substrate binding protein [Paracraurococcus sp. LOR1-02]|uniref:Tripartite tricarboxylate transporter substrate binding protein n=2 Tax=Paracraurococcus lichenis TaxID=3064888 RepID=A0ABT9E9E3_9PROT|nr:tripartite tricarboxylate transporter substrate binding protein [Paracraurococcus sp. LOR1-02]MDO9712826.1 tripartite tricarboxylate transporter substrate binding protein [Paracraurococcus sp. LOR1-02]
MVLAAAAANLAGGPWWAGWAEVVQGRPIRIVVPVPPGVSSIDLAARAVARVMQETLNAPVLVENQPGGGGILAAEAVLRTPPDGHTLFLGGVGSLVDVFLAAGRQPLDPLRDLVPVGRVTRDHWLVAAAPSLGAASVAELVALARQRPGELTYASFGVGSPFHVAAVRFCRGVGIEATHVPYRDSYMGDLLAGRISFVVQSSAPVQPHVAAGRLRGLAVLSATRLPGLPEVPTIAETGHSDLDYNSGVVLYAPGGTLAGAVSRLNAALNEALRVSALRARFAELGLEATEGSPADAERFVRWNMAANEDARAAILAERNVGTPEGRPR